MYGIIGLFVGGIVACILCIVGIPVTMMVMVLWATVQEFFTKNP